MEPSPITTASNTPKLRRSSSLVAGLLSDTRSPQIAENTIPLVPHRAGLTYQISLMYRPKGGGDRAGGGSAADADGVASGALGAADRTGGWRLPSAGIGCRR